MIGRKKLSAIRDDLRQALAAEGDPVQWLERLTASREGDATRPSGENEITESLQRLLKAGRKPPRRRAKAER
jgi:hypothetical protein